MGYSELCKKIENRFKNIRRKSLERIISEDIKLASDITKAYENDEISEEQYNDLIKFAGYNNSDDEVT